MFGIYHDVTIRASRTSILKALTTTAGFNAWWTKECYGRLYVGEHFNFVFSDEYNWYAYVDAYEPNKSIKYLMIQADEDWVDTTLNFEVLNVSKTKFLLRFEHEGWKVRNDHFRRTSYCWAQYLSNLKLYLETGKIIPFGKRTNF